MPIIKLNATDSTNVYLKELVLSQPLEDFTVVSAELQRKGRGQIGADWHSEKGRNLTVSVLKKLMNFDVENQFNLNCIVSLAVYEVLSELSVPDLSVKWPNDILSGNQKICGILIENMLKGKQINLSIIGIGLNVNQTDFKNLEKATSIKLQLGHNLDLDELIQHLLNRLKFNFSLGSNKIAESYKEKLFRLNKLSIFKNVKGEEFHGVIRGIDANGHLLVETKKAELKKFSLKEVSLLY